MIPIRHTLPARTVPVVNRALVAANVVVFIAQLMNAGAAERLIDIFGFMPARLIDPGRFHYAFWEAALTLDRSIARSAADANFLLLNTRVFGGLD